jgi:hypothetical protein
MMLRYWIIVVCVVSLNFLAYSQQRGFNIPLYLDGSLRNTLEQTIDLRDFKAEDFISVSVRLEGENIKTIPFELKLITDKTTYKLKPFHEQFESDEDVFVSELIYLQPEEAGICQLRLDLDTMFNYDIKVNGFIRVFVPQSDIKYKVGISSQKALDKSCICPQPDYIARSDWGNKFLLGPNIYHPPASYTNVTHLIIHHSAGTNTSNNWKGVVASIFDFHVNANKWQDVGYNWLVDPNGVIYEGRGGGDNVIGAHMCGYNKNTMGICVLGDFNLVEPTLESISALEKLLAYKACKEDISADGSSNINSFTGHMHHISGHKQGCSPTHTDCPGHLLFAKMEAIRSETKDYIATECVEVTANEEIITESMLIYPNPAENIFCVKKADQIKIINIQGIDVTSRINKTGENCFEISSLTSGIYFVQVFLNEKWQLSKVVKL